MAHTALRLRRAALSLTPQLLAYTRPTTAAATTTLLHHNTTTTSLTLTHHRSFHSSQRLSFSASRSYDNTDKIDPDTILFEGCDYNHFLIVMDFGKDPAQRPSPEQMVETYVQTAAQVLGSVEEAKKRIYACSTTTYTGFQVEVDEATSNKFEGLPGVIFVLPDSYIDPANKEYGGDKYDNGIIIPRPPPVQYGRTSRGVRTNDRETRESMHRNPAYNQQRNPVYNQQATPVYNQQATPTPVYNQQATPTPVYNQQATPVYNQHGSLPPPPPPPGPHQYGRGYLPPPPPPPGPHQGFSQQQRFPPQPNNLLLGQASGTHLPVVHQGGVTNFVPPVQGNYNHGYNHSQGQMNNQSGNYGGYTPPGPHQSNPVDYAYNNAQGQMGFSGDNRSSFPSPVTGPYGQTGAGAVEQNGAGQYGQGPTGYTPNGQNQSFPQTSNVQISPTGHGSYPPWPTNRI